MEDEDKEPGRTSRTKPHCDPGMFFNVQSVGDFAAALSRHSRPHRPYDGYVVSNQDNEMPIQCNYR